MANSGTYENNWASFLKQKQNEFLRKNVCKNKVLQIIYTCKCVLLKLHYRRSMFNTVKWNELLYISGHVSLVTSNDSYIYDQYIQYFCNCTISRKGVNETHNTMVIWVPVHAQDKCPSHKAAVSLTQLTLQAIGNDLNLIFAYKQLCNMHNFFLRHLWIHLELGTM